MQEVTLSQILLARENRADLQKELIGTYNCPLISFTMNIAGPVKYSPQIERAFNEGIAFLKNEIPAEKILNVNINILPTGCEAFFSVAMDQEKLKEICVSIEESCPLGRLFDMDVLDTSFNKLERKNTRGCIVCSKPGRACAAGRVHSVAELQEVTSNLIKQHFLTSDGRKIARLATESLLQEVYTTPKPGLVDRRNNGSHTDMNISTFEKSAHALTPYFCECFYIGQKTADTSFCKTFDMLRSAGLDAEQKMYQATNGVNTHKGAIYSMGVICGALGRLWSPEKPFANTDDIFSVCADIVNDAVKSDFYSIDTSTAGGRLYLEHGIKGIRGEVFAGFPTVKFTSLPVYSKALDNGLTANDAGVVALLHLVRSTDDTNLYHRGGFEGAHYAADYAAKLLEESEFPSLSQIEKMDDDFISKNLSPGGCADLLAVTYFIYELKKWM